MGTPPLFSLAQAEDLAAPFCAESVQTVLSHYGISESARPQPQPTVHWPQSDETELRSYYQKGLVIARVNQTRDKPEFHTNPNVGYLGVIELRGLGPAYTQNFNFGRHREVTYSPTVVYRFNHPNEAGTRCEFSEEIGLSFLEFLSPDEPSASELISSPAQMAYFGNFKLNSRFCELIKNEPPLSKEETSLGIVLNDFEQRATRFIQSYMFSESDPDRFGGAFRYSPPSAAAVSEIAQNEMLRLVIPLAFRACIDE